MPSASTRIKGKAGLFKLAGTDYSIDCTSILLTSEDADNDTVTFCEVGTGGKTWKFEVEAIQSTAAGSLWNYLWTSAGTTNVAVIYAPHGNATATTAQPHFTGTVTLPGKPDVGGEADTTYTFSTEIVLDAEPTKVTA